MPVLFGVDDGTLIGASALAMSVIGIVKNYLDRRADREDKRLIAETAQQERADKAKYDSTLLALKAEDARQEVEIEELKQEVKECHDKHERCEEDKRIGIQIARELAEKRAKEMDQIAANLEYIRQFAGIPKPPPPPKSGVHPKVPKKTEPRPPAPE